MSDPLDQLRQEQKQARRGRLKVFLGMAAGVGKTYSMLSEAQELRARGEDVVIGFLEPHGRKETESLADGMEQLPPKLIVHRGVTIREFNLDAALERRPFTMLVDELAHTNPEGCRHAKRWQDIEELLAAGINVVTTVNIQHLESLRDVVAQVTGVVVQETVPDAFFDQAAEIELVDIAPEQLHQRLREGKVYGHEKVDQAIEGFFKRTNLLALRELSLRHTAERVDKELRASRDLAQSTDAWHTGERVLVCVAPSRLAPRVVRSARRLASSLHAELLAVTVESSRQGNASPADRASQEAALALAGRLGAKTFSLAGEDIANEIVGLARRQNVTTIVMGKPARPRWYEILVGSVVDATIKKSGDIDVLIITGAEDPGSLVFRRPAVRTIRWRGIGEAILSVAACTAIGLPTIDQLHLSNVVMLYLVGVVAVSVRNGVIESLIASVLSVAALDFFFVRPRFTFAVSDSRYLVTFVVMAGVSVLLSGLTVRLRQSSENLARRERTTSALYELSRSLVLSRRREDMALAACEKVTDLLGCSSYVLVNTPSGLATLACSHGSGALPPNDLAVAAWVIDKGKPAGASTDTLSGASCLFVPVGEHGLVHAALGLEISGRSQLELPERHLVDSIANQLSGALERVRLAIESHETALAAESEQLRGDLLSSVSHDLRTPLAVIEGSAASLLSQPELSAASRELGQSIQNETQRMSKLVRNLLDMTRVQGEVRLSLDWHNPSDLIENAIDRTASQFRERPEFVPPQKPLLIRVDGVLIEQVLVNLLENAGAHGAEPVSVSLDWDSSAVRICVQDSGRGVEPGQESAVFTRFHKGGPGGFGLGLAISKAAVEAHEGTITVANLEPGCRFTIELPNGTLHA